MSLVRVDVGTVTEVREARRVIVDAEGQSVGVFAVGDDFYAVINVCPHQLAPICLGELTGTMLPSAPGEFVHGLDGLVLRCFRHGWEFDIRTGATVQGTDRRRLRTVPVTVEEDRVYVELRAPRRRTAAAAQAADGA